MIGDDRPRPTPEVWVTRDGQRLHVTQMRDAHLMNAIRWLIRNAARIKRRTIDYLAEVHCTLDELQAHGGVVDLHALPADQVADREPLAQMLNSVRSVDEIGDLVECIELMNGDEVLIAAVVTWPALVREARRRGLLRPQGQLTTGRPQLPGDVDTHSDQLQRVETRVEPTRRGWS